MTIHEHIDWLKIYVEGMTPDNWIDMRLRCERQLNELTAALSDQWQDISTAPKDEMFIWAYKHDSKWRLGLAYQNVSGSWSDAYGSDAPRRATHWSPLPAPPPSSTAGGGE